MGFLNSFIFLTALDYDIDKLNKTSDEIKKVMQQCKKDVFSAECVAK